MTGTILFTGANSSAGVHAVEQLLEHHSEFTAILMVRDAGVNDVNTQNLRQVIARYPMAKATIHQLDNSNLTSVHEFATKISASIAAGEFPRLRAIVCNASYWNLVLDSELTVDSYDKTIQVNYIAHVALVLRLLDSFDYEGRIVLLSSVGHYRKPNAVTSHIPEIPDDIDQLHHPPPDQDKEGRGFQRYANSKLLLTTWMYPLNRYLQQCVTMKNPKLKDITVVTINPGGLGDSRCFTSNTPQSMHLKQTFILKPFMGVINRLVDPTFRSSAKAGRDIAELAVNKAYAGERGYFTMLNKDESDPLTLDEGVQERVWKKSLKWAKITKDNTALMEAVE